MFKPQNFSIRKRRLSKKTTIWHLIFISPLLVIMFGFGIWSLESSIELTQNGITTEAKITQVQITRDEDSTQYRPTFEFKDASGKTHSKTSKNSSSTRYEKGQMVSVLYLVNSPQKSAKINTFADLWLLPIMLLSISVLVELALIAGYLNRHEQTNSINTTNPILMFGTTVKSRYWQTINDIDGKKLEVQYEHEGKTYKTKSHILNEKQLRKLRPGEEIQLKINPKDPTETIVFI